MLVLLFRESAVVWLRVTRRSLAGRLKIFSAKSQLKHSIPRLRMLSDDLGCGVTLAARMEAREGEFHGLMLDCLPSRRLAGSALEDDVLPRERRYHSRFTNFKHFLILICNEFQNGTD